MRLIESVSILTYDEDGRDGRKSAPVVNKPPVAAGDGSGFLIVDDLVDTGTTARVVRGLLPKAHFACVYAKPAGREMVDTFHHRGVAGHLDPVSVGHRAAVRRAPGEAGRVIIAAAAAIPWPPARMVFSRSGHGGGCGHVSGLFARHQAAGPDGNRGSTI